VTPHVYLTQKRVERAQEMLVQTGLSLAEIAFAAGFFDQGHLARHFRHMLGTTPTCAVGGGIWLFFGILDRVT